MSHVIRFANTATRWSNTIQGEAKSKHIQGAPKLTTSKVVYLLSLLVITMAYNITVGTSCAERLDCILRADSVHEHCTQINIST